MSPWMVMPAEAGRDIICVYVYMYNPVKKFLSSSMREVVQSTQQIAGLSLQEGYQTEHRSVAGQGKVCVAPAFKVV